ncbi:hypothetical protein BT96DRAFT_920349 [Gymnopus androsaceus JB14]|uniref:Uncharacterized protein n=1 Tax=Gymnopus androsaceus JB14 TaxID=1447944 RepID=A0A6A4HM91_9AGAR|nr:hypothetical protein BT96DRAFT_920349 [Gymnopus androsaceus JB14]
MAILESTTERLQSHNSSLAEERTNLQVSLDRCRHENTKLESNADAHMSELSTLRERVAVLQDQLSEFARLKEERSSLQSALSVQKSENAVLHSEKARLQKSVDKHTSDATEIARRIEKNRVELVEVQEQRSKLRTKVEKLNEDLKAQTQAMSKASEEYRERLARQEEASERLLNAEMKRAETAEQGLSELTKELTKRFASMELKLESATVASNLSGREDAEVEGRIGHLEADNARLRERERNLERRYREGDLNDEEKEFVNSLIRFSQDMHEKEMVEKENDLRRRDNMVTTLQQKIEKLESTLAKCLKGKGKGTVANAAPDPKAKSMLDLNMWMSSSPVGLMNVDHKQTTSTAAATATTTIVPAPPSASASRLAPPSSPVLRQQQQQQQQQQSKSPKTPTFAKLEEDISDFEEDIPSVKLGKRSRPVSPPIKSTQDADTSHPATRRSKIVTKKGTENQEKAKAQEKTAGNTKVKPRKRR